VHPTLARTQPEQGQELLVASSELTYDQLRHQNEQEQAKYELGEELQRFMRGGEVRLGAALRLADQAREQSVYSMYF
jgi:hypothetical protein